MLLPIILLLAALCMSNVKRARQKQLNPFTWVCLTIFSFCFGIFAGCFILGMIIMIKNPGLLNMAQTNDRAGMNKFMLENFAQHELLYSSLIFAGGFGGYLLIRYILEQKRTPPQEQ